MTEDELAAITARLDVVRDFYRHDREGEAFRLIAGDVPRLVAEVRRLRAALTEYGRHQEGCSAQWGAKHNCMCGWREDSAALGIPVPPEGKDA